MNIEEVALLAWEAIACILIADFLSGLGHWFEDTYSVPTWPFLGRIIAEPNINHHINPSEMAPTFIGRNWFQLVPACIFLAILYSFGLLSWQISVVTVFLALANETHAWCHMRNKNRLIAFLQEMSLVITVKNHNVHHKDPYTRAYCVITNWINPIVDRLYLWSFLEYFISIFGIYPKRGTEERDFV